MTRINLEFLYRPFFTFVTLPAAIAILIGLLAVVGIVIEYNFVGDVSYPFVLHFAPESARATLSVVATGAMTALSLTYSLVLVVFTLAAGNIGPRLLKRLSSERVSQITAGVLGGTFLYAVLALIFMQPEFVPKVTIGGAVLLAVLSVVQLIYFVRYVAQSVMVDDEIAHITHGIEAQIKEKTSNSPTQNVTDFDLDILKFDIISPKTGYLGHLDQANLLAFTKDHACIISFETFPGDFIVEGEVFARVNRALDAQVCNAFFDLFAIGMTRSAHKSIGFSINLLLEIGLRALSPGINDTFTAISVVNGLSAIFVRMDDKAGSGNIICNEQGEVRLLLPDLSLKKLMGRAFHPFRRCCGDNVLMAQGLARAYARLYLVGSETMRTLVSNHAGLLLRQLEKNSLLPDDLESVLEILPSELHDKITKPVGE